MVLVILPKNIFGGGIFYNKREKCLFHHIEKEWACMCRMWLNVVTRCVYKISKGGFMKRFKAQKAYLVLMSILTIFMILPGCS